MHARIVAAYTEQATIEHGESPVRRRFVTVTGEESQIFMEDVSLTPQLSQHSSAFQGGLAEEFL